VTVLDTSGAIDYLTESGVADEVGQLLETDPQVPLAAPEVIVVEMVSALRPIARRRKSAAARASAAIADLASMRVDLFPMLPLRRRAWEFRDNFTAGDAMFVALAELLDEPLATKDQRLARAASQVTAVETILLGSQ